MDPESYKIKAFNELGETDELKVEKLEEFKSWISNHQFLKNARKGKQFLSCSARLSIR